MKVNIELSVNEANLELTHAPHFINVGVVWAITPVASVAVYRPLNLAFGCLCLNYIVSMWWQGSLTSFNPWSVLFFTLFLIF